MWLWQQASNVFFISLSLQCLTFNCNGAIEKQIIIGKIYTVNPDQPWVEAIGIDENGIIEAAGSEEDVIQAFSGDVNVTTTRLEDGHIMLPGFHDVHLHAVEAGINNDESICYIEDVFVYPEDLPYDLEGGFGWDCKVGEDGWVFATGVDISFLMKAIEEEGSDYPLNVLDEWFPDSPVLILDSLGHGTWYYIMLQVIDLQCDVIYDLLPLISNVALCVFTCRGQKELLPTARPSSW